MFYHDFCFYLSKLQCIIASSNTPYVFILCNFNADIQSTSIFRAELIDFCDNNELCFIDKEMLFPDTFTYTSQAHGTTSWLDHCITTMSGQSIISHVSIIDNVVCSDHFPLCIEVECDIIPLYNSTMTSVVNSSIQWHAAKDSDKLQYMIKSEKLVSKIVLPVDALTLSDPGYFRQLTIRGGGGFKSPPPPYDLENYCVNLHHIIHVNFTRCFWHDPIGIFQKFVILTILQRFQNKK